MALNTIMVDEVVSHKSERTKVMTNEKFNSGDVIVVSRVPNNSRLIPYQTYKIESINNDVVCLRCINSNNYYKEAHQDMTLTSAFQYKILLRSKNLTPEPEAA